MSGSAGIVITGDTHLGGGRITELAQKNSVEELFGDFLPMIREADLSITNLESPVIDGGEPIAKTGPALKSPVDSLGVLKTAGFGLVTLANNHIMDYGSEGLFSTLDSCKNEGIETTGAGSSFTEARKPWHIEINGIRISVINIAENEFGTTHGEQPGCHPLDPVQNYYTIQNAKRSSDKVIVIVHGGHEHYELPSPRMKQTYRFFVDSGADAVAGHHTHCVSGFEVYKDAPIFYSLGNFLFDKQGTNGGELTPWNKGLILKLTIDKKRIGFEYCPYLQNSKSAGLHPMSEKMRNEFEVKISRLNSIIENDAELEYSFEKYCRRSYRLYSSYIEPHSVTLLHALRNRNLLPSLLAKRKKRLLLNLTRCEAHRDVLIKTLSL